MTDCTVKVKLNEGAKLPVYSSEQAAGADICACLSNSPFILKAHSFSAVPTGLFIELPVGYEAQIRPRSGLAAKNGITVLNSPGTVDSDYRGEIKVILINHSDKDFEIHTGDRIAQMVIAPHSKSSFETMFSLEDTERGAGGFGSTGIK